MSSSSTVYLVSCVSAKLEQKACAQDLYVSDWFRKARRYVEASGHPWYILSAKYGLVPPLQKIAPYERTLNTMTIAERRTWALGVLRELTTTVPKLSKVVFLAGERYREFLQQSLRGRGITVSIPMKGLKIGEQLSWLKQHAPKN